MILALAWSALASAPPGLSPTGQAMWAQAEADQVAGREERAASQFQAVWRAEGHPAAAVQAAAAWALAGQGALGVSLLEEVRADPDAHGALAMLLWDLGRKEEACEVARRGQEVFPEAPEVWWVGALCAADVDSVTASQNARMWLGFAAHRDVDLERALALGRGLHAGMVARGDLTSASEILRTLRDRVPATSSGLASLLDETEMRRRARRLAFTSVQVLEPDQYAVLGAVRREVRAGNLGAANTLIEDLGRRVPWNPEVRGLRAEVRAAQRRYAEAEADYRVAELLDPLDPRWPERRGRLLATAFAGRDVPEIVACFERSLALAPDRPAVWLERARWEAVAGRSEAALASAMRAADSPALNPEATELIANLKRKPLVPDAVPPGRACPGGVPEAACEGYFLAIAWQRRADPGDRASGRASDADLAWAEIQRVRVLAPRWVAAINLQAALRKARPGDARREVSALWEESLSLDPDQGDVAWALGRLYLDGGDLEAAERSLDLATRLPGGGGAHLDLALIAARGGDLERARAQLGRLREADVALEPEAEIEAVRLEKELNHRDFQRQAALVGGVAALGLAAVGGLAWWRRGVTVDAWLDRDPRVRTEVARLAGTIKHEILKHHTAWLDTAAAAIEVGDPGPALFLADRLYGDTGALTRLDGYMAGLRELARASGVHLALTTRDPVFRPLLRAAARLRGAEVRVRAGKPAVARELRSISRMLRERVDPGLSALARPREVTRLGRAWLEEVVARTLAEPAWRDKPPPSVRILRVDEAAVAAPPAALGDALGNLVRNALQVSVPTGDPVGVSVVIEEDPLTLVETVAMRVLDHHPSRPDTTTLRSRAPDRGLGLVREVVTSRGGSLSIEDEEGWSKAMVMRLPLVRTEVG